MNQQQRAGKHPSFSRGQKPFGTKRGNIPKSFIAPKPRLFRKAKNVSKVTLVTSEQMDIQPSQLLFYSCSFSLEARFEGHLSEYLRILKKLSLLDLLSYEVAEAFLDAVLDSSWKEYLEKGKFQTARECVLHLAVVNAIETRNHDMVSQLLPQIHTQRYVMCVLNKAATADSDTIFFHCMMIVYKTKYTSLKPCLEDALRCKKWPLVQKLITLRDDLTNQDTDTVLQAVIENKQWELIQMLMKQSTNVILLNMALVQALAERQWRLLKDCLNRGGDIATACTENDFDLNVRIGTKCTTVLRDAITQKIMGELSMNMVESLLKAGADPDVQDINSETAIHDAVDGEEWDLVTLLLKYSRTAGKTASKRMSDGSTLLHKVCEEGQTDILHTLLMMKANPLVKNGNGETLMMTAMKSPQDRESLIRVLIQAGAATHQAVTSKPVPTPFTSERTSRIALLRLLANTGHTNLSVVSLIQQALECGELRVAKLLYASGSCSYRDIHQLPALEFKGANSEEIRDFVSAISSQPRSLLETCALTISHLIGCGPERDVRAASTGLPVPLRRLVLQDHVINPDLLKDCPPDPPGRTHFRLYRSSLVRYIDSWLNWDVWGVGRQRMPHCSCQSLNQ